jgi:hypothetical protein
MGVARRAERERRRDGQQNPVSTRVHVCLPPARAACSAAAQ